jgi:hypothetical protein
MFGPTPAPGFYLRLVKHLQVSHTEVQARAADARPSFYLDDVNRADFIAITAPKGQPAFSLHNVTISGWPSAAQRLMSRWRKSIVARYNTVSCNANMSMPSLAVWAARSSCRSHNEPAARRPGVC